MKTVFVAKEHYDRAGFRIVGIFETKEEAENSISIDKSKYAGDFYEVAELDVGRWFDIDELGAR